MRLSQTYFDIILTDMDNVNNQNGSRRWKIDFHAHTPCSRDYKDVHVDPAEWVRAAVATGLDAVVVADHNSGEWIDRHNEAVMQMQIQNARKAGM